MNNFFNFIDIEKELKYQDKKILSSKINLINRKNEILNEELNHNLNFSYFSKVSFCKTKIKLFDEFLIFEEFSIGNLVENNIIFEIFFFENINIKTIRNNNEERKIIIICQIKKDIIIEKIFKIKEYFKSSNIIQRDVEFDKEINHIINDINLTDKELINIYFIFEINSNNKSYYIKDITNDSYFLYINEFPLIQYDYNKSNIYKNKNDNIEFSFIKNYKDEIWNLIFANCFFKLKTKLKSNYEKFEKILKEFSFQEEFINNNIGELKIFSSNKAAHKIDTSIVEKYSGYLLDNIFNQSLIKFLENFTENKINEKIKFSFILLSLICQGFISYLSIIDWLINSKIQCKYNFNLLEIIFTLENIHNIYLNKTKLFTFSTFENYIIENVSKKLEHNVNLNCSFLIDTLKIKVQQSFIKFFPIMKDIPNRIMRSYLNEYFCIKCSFLYNKISNLFLFYKIYLLDIGVNIYNQSYKFFCYSQSQFRNNSCFLISYDREKLLKDIGNFDNIKSIAKYAARIGQTLSSTFSTINIQKNQIGYTNDRNFNDYIFTDGSSRISFKFGEKISIALNLKTVPSIFQARFLGGKGIWTVIKEEDRKELINYNKEGEVNKSKEIEYFKDEFIELRPSQEKFNLKNIKIEGEPFEVCDYSKFIPLFLNKQIILLLSTLSKNREEINNVIFKKYKEYLSLLFDDESNLKLISFSCIRNIVFEMLKFNFNSTNNNFVYELSKCNKNILIKNIINKHHIYLKYGAYVIGSSDEFGYLKEDECFLRIEDDINNVYVTLNKKCIITKCPCIHPGDIRIVTFVDNYDIYSKYPNTLIFNTRGNRPLPDQISNSDLDGDCYFIIYDDDIIQNIEMKDPSNFKSGEIKEKLNIGFEDIIEYFCHFSLKNNLGLVADTHLSISDASKNLCNDEKSIELTEKYYMALDAPKTGKFPELLGDKVKRPHYLSKIKNWDSAKYFHSNSILGIIYDDIIKYNDNCFEVKNKIINLKNSIESDNEFYYESIYLILKYVQKLKVIIDKYGFLDEYELFSGTIKENKSKFDVSKNNYDTQEKIRLDLEIFLKEISFNVDELLGLNFLKDFMNKRLYSIFTIRENFYTLNIEKLKEKFIQICLKNINIQNQNTYENFEDLDFIPNLTFDSYDEVINKINKIDQEIHNFLDDNSVNINNYYSFCWIIGSNLIIKYLDQLTYTN